jgi:hypothetical protein
MAAQVEVAGPDAAAVAWVQHQWDSLWQAAAHQLLRAKLYGFLPFRVVYRLARSGPFAGLLEVERLIDEPPSDVRLLTRGEQIVGFETSSQSSHHAPRDVPPSDADDARHSRARHAERDGYTLAPAGLVCTFDAQCTSPHGCALLARAYPAWFEKWMPGGAKRTLRLRMVKDAYIGDILWYPANQLVQMADGKQVSWRDLAREVVESRTSGGAMTLPLVRDSLGNKLVEYTPPQGVPGHTQIFNWKRDLDLEIWKALEVPPEIIQASSSGSGYSGRWIPFAVALSAVHQELVELVQCVDRDILRPIAQLNFGRESEHVIRPKSLVETYSRMFGQDVDPIRRRQS